MKPLHRRATYAAGYAALTLGLTGALTRFAWNAGLGFEFALGRAEQPRGCEHGRTRNRVAE